MKRITLALLSMLLVPLAMMAQDVTVHPGNGSMMPALKSGNTDTFYQWSGFATWKHEQLSLTMTTGDSDNNLTGTNDQLTSSGQLAKPANDIFATTGTGTKYLQIGKGKRMNTYLTIALPKGYRFTGYTIIFHRISAPAGKPSSASADNYNGNISFGETDNTFTYTSTTNTSANNITTYRGDIGQNNTTQYTISRTSDTDMTNVLYFKLATATSVGYRAFIQLDHVELYFTAEHNTPTLIPAQTATEVSAVDIPFTTSKIDYGQLVKRDINGNISSSSSARMSYDGTIRDMNANMVLYEKGSVETITAAQNDFDGTAGDIVKYQSGSISSAGNFFKLESSKHPRFNYDDGEAIYYIESPIWAVNSAATNPHKNPIGYRIVSATFNYEAGTGSVYLPATFKIQFESTGHGPNEDGTYGLNLFSGTYNWNPSYHTVWRIDQEGYIYGYNTSNGTTYYLAVDGSDIGMTTTKPTATNGTFEVVNNQIRLKSDNTKYIGWNETVNGTYVDDNGNTNDNVTRYFVIAADDAHRSTYNELSAATTGSHGEYTLKIYGPDGETVARTINVGEEGGSVTVTGYNNDAIKIGVVGTALINAEITMQALDPYIDRLDIVCQESGGTGGKLTQQFSATDFAVKGGQFTFYVPTGFPAPAKFTFENLYSHYGDETYYNTPSANHARYFFVKSPYEQTAANVYNRDNEASYTTKILTEKVGNTKFTFNNASTVGNAGGWFEEYAFNPSTYSSFIDFTFNQTEMTNGTVKTAYLFTCDEPRYNIAPTTATQHVYYAFYEMKIDMQTKTYAPVLTWEKVYDTTFNGDGKTDSKWGLTLTTTETVDDHGTHSGYLTVTQILDKIGERTGNNTVAGGPKTTDQILFVDGSKLMSIVENQTSTGTGSNITYTSHPKSELKAILDRNALIYLPYGSKSSDVNFAFNTIEDYTKTPSFRAANDVVLTDKETFYAPYDIQVDAAKKVEYKRLITTDKYGKVQNASLILPFALKLEGGTHTNVDGTTFSLHTMKSGQTLQVKDNQLVAYFPALSDVSTAAANTPYLVKLDANSTEDNVSFIVSQNGATISKTKDVGMATDYTFSGEKATGVSAAGGSAGAVSEATFTPKGTYAGQQVPKAQNIFYFASNVFVNSKDYKYGDIKVAPFRAYFVTSAAAAKIASFGVTFEEGEGNGVDAIDAISTWIDVNAPVYDLQGRKVATSYREAKGLQSGMYVVNGVKIIVK